MGIIVHLGKKGEKHQHRGCHHQIMGMGPLEEFESSVHFLADQIDDPSQTRSLA